MRSHGGCRITFHSLRDRDKCLKMEMANGCRNPIVHNSREDKRFPRTYLTSRQTVLPISWFLWISILRIHSFMSDTFHSRSVKAYGSFFDFLEMFFLVFSWFGDILICWQNSHEPLDFSLFLSFLKTSRLTDLQSLETACLL